MLRAPDFRLYHGNDLEILARVLAAELARPVPETGPLAPETILIPQPALRRWLQKTLAETHGIAANLRFLTPGEFVREALAANLADGDDAALADAASLRWRLWTQLADPATRREPVFAPLAPVLAGPDPALAAWTLAGELAHAFENYQAWRRDWLLHWGRGGAPGDWQAELWRRASRGRSHRARRLEAYLARFGGDGAEAPVGLPPRLFAFACQNVSPDVLRVIASAARVGTLHFFFVSPVDGWWGDLRSARERLRAAPRAVFADDDENPLLRANGAAGRDFVRTLFSYEVVHPSWEQAIYVAPDPAHRPGLLHRLQRDLLARDPPPPPDAPDLHAFDAAARADRSLQVHACHTRLREVQVLHDQLRALFEDPGFDPPLQPREVAVLAPDIDAYAPHVHAVFGAAEGDATRFIPYALADGSALAGQPLVEAFLTLLALPSARFTANDVMDLMALPAIAQRFGLAADDFPRLRDWLHEAGVRWGLNAQHRAALDAPAESAYTWAWALDRLLLGYASGAADDIAGVAPWPALEGAALATLDASLQALRALARLQQRLGRAQTVAVWQAQLLQALEDVFPTRARDPGDQRALEYLREQIRTFARQVERAELSAPLPPAVVRAWFTAALNEADARQPFLSGGVTFGRMVPMRLIPFRVICLLGLNDGDYPRRDPAGGLNRLSAQLGTRERRSGDRSLREDDRMLFLQLLAAAGEVFYLSYLGRDPRSGEALAPSVVVAELLDVAARYFRAPRAGDDAATRDARAHLVLEHPLQPFAAEAFGRGDARRVSYHAQWQPAAQTGAGERAALPPFAAPLPAATPVADEGRYVSRDDLDRVLAYPLRAWLRQRLGVRLPAPEERLPDSEPFDGNDGLRRHALAQRVFAELAARDDRPDLEALSRRLLAEGRIAPGAAGIEEVAGLVAELAAHARTWRRWARGPAQARPYELALGAFVLTGTIESIHEPGLLQFRAGKPHGRSLLALGLDALVWSALGETRPVHRIIAAQGASRLSPLPPATARAVLRDWLERYAHCLEQPLPFAPKAGHAYVQALARGRPEAAAWAAAFAQWQTREGHGEGQDAWVRLALRGRDPFADPEGAAAQRFRATAHALFDPLAAFDTGAGDD